MKRPSPNPYKRSAVMTADAQDVRVLLLRYELTDMLARWQGDYITQTMLEDIPEDVGLYVLTIRMGKMNASLPITALTEDALDCFVAAIKEIAEEVRPEIRAADERARNERHEGIPDSRLYAAIPQIHHRDGSVTIYIEGVPQRFEGDGDVEIRDPL